jgi:hypothetical protein
MFMVTVSEVAIGAKYCVGRVESLLNEEPRSWPCGGSSTRGGNIAACRHTFVSLCGCFVIA